MKSKLLFAVALLAFGVVVSSCKKDEPPAPTDEELQTQKLVGTWVLPSNPPTNTVTIQSLDVTQDWTSFQLTFTETGYSTVGAGVPEVWPSSGTWAFASGDVNTIQRSDGVDISINVSETTLTMSFNYTAGGRLMGTEGEWQFNGLVKQ